MLRRLLSIIFIIILTLEIRFFYLIDLPANLDRYNTSGNKTIIVIMCILGFFIVFISKKSVKIIKKSIFKQIILLLFILILVEIFISTLNYHQGLKSMIALISSYCIILLYFILLVYINVNGSVKFLKRTIVYFSFLLSIIFIIQAIYYNMGHDLFLRTWEIDMTGVGSRFGRIRLTKASPFISLGYILSFGELINKNNKNKFYKIVCVLSILSSGYYMIYVCQTRMLIGILLICSVCMILYNYRKNKSKIIFGIVLSILALIIVSKVNTYQEYKKSYTDIQYQQSYTARLGAIKYYTKIGFNNLIFGNGLVDPIYGKDSYSIVRGPYGDYYLEDTGFIGFFSSFGICGFIWYIYLLIKIFNTLNKLNKLNKLNNHIENIGFFIFILLTSGTLFILNVAFIIIFPIMLFFIDWSMSNKYHT